MKQNYFEKKKNEAKFKKKNEAKFFGKKLKLNNFEKQNKNKTYCYIVIYTFMQHHNDTISKTDA